MIGTQLKNIGMGSRYADFTLLAYVQEIQPSEGELTASKGPQPAKHRRASPDTRQDSR